MRSPRNKGGTRVGALADVNQVDARLSLGCLSAVRPVSGPSDRRSGMDRFVPWDSGNRPCAL